MDRCLIIKEKSAAEVFSMLYCRNVLHKSSYAPCFQNSTQQEHLCDPNASPAHGSLTSMSASRVDSPMTWPEYASSPVLMKRVPLT